MTHPSKISRRSFLQNAGSSALLASIFPSVVPASVLGADGNSSPGSRINLGCIGTGERGRQVMAHFLNQPDCRVVAVCDVKKDAMSKAQRTVNDHYKRQDCAAIHDFRELVARPDVDAVLIASTDNWHVLHALAAVRAGKDLYVEKPLGLSLGENQLLRQEVIRHKRVCQFGTQQRSERKFRIACELVRNGYIGKLRHINVWSPSSREGGSTAEAPPPATLDYDFWLGPAKKRPYTEDLAQNTTWFHVSDFALGFIAGWGIHPMDIALWGAGDLATGSVDVSGKGSFPTKGICNTATAWDVKFQFLNGLTLNFLGAQGANLPQRKEWTERYGPIAPHGTAFEGTEGWVHVNRQRISMQPENLIEINPDEFKSRLTYSTDHVKSFLNAIRTRRPTVSPIEAAVLSDSFCHVADLGIRLGRKLTYDVEREKFVGDAEAGKRLELRAMRSPWDTLV